MASRVDSDSSVSGGSSTAHWFQFLLDAGIEPSDAGRYSVKFTENRIKQNMFGEINKQSLNEMGITVLGDTIAIMKHAKLVSANSGPRKKDTFDLSLRPTSTTSVDTVGRFREKTSSRGTTKSSRVQSAQISFDTADDFTIIEPIQDKPSSSKLAKSDVARKSEEGRKPDSCSSQLPAKHEKSKMRSDRLSVTVFKVGSSGAVRTKPGKEELPMPISRSLTPTLEGRIRQKSGSVEISRKIIPHGAVERPAHGSSHCRKVSESSSSESDSECSSDMPINSGESKKSVFSRLGGSLGVMKRKSSVINSSDANGSGKRSYVDEDARYKKRAKLESTLPSRYTSVRIHSEGILGSGSAGCKVKPVKARLGRTSMQEPTALASLRAASSQATAKTRLRTKPVYQVRKPVISSRVMMSRLKPVEKAGVKYHSLAQDRPSGSGSVFSRLGN